MSFEYILLGLLQKPASGYDLKQRFDAGVRHFWRAELAQIYPALKRLEGKGWLAVETRPSQRGPQRKVYRLTAAGRQELDRWLTGGVQLGTRRRTELAQIWFLGQRRPAAVPGLLGELRERYRAEYARLEGVERHWRAACPGAPASLDDADLARYVTLKNGLAILAAQLQWSEEMLALYQPRQAAESDHDH